jgi:hypothetical protein
MDPSGEGLKLRNMVMRFSTWNLRYRWVDNIKMDLGEIAWGGMG